MSKLSKAINQIKPITKDSVNPHFKNKYFDINSLLYDVKPILSENGLMLLQPIKDGKVISQIIDIDTNEVIAESELELTANLNAQQKGSEITYFRRYTLQSLLGLEAEDDDANIASSTQPSTPEPSEWLNLFDKQGKKTPKFLEIEKAISDGNKFTLKTIRTKYKVSKEVESQLKTNFNII
jgi:hypothetical protein